MARLIALAAVMIAVVVAVSGCGSSSSGGASKSASHWPALTKKPVTLHVLMVHEIVYADQSVDQMDAAFEKLHPNIHIQMDFVSYDELHDKIVTDQIGGSGTYDAVVMDNIWPAEFAQADIVRNITTHIPASYKAGTYPLVWKAATYKGQIYGVPWGGIAMEHLFYNKKMLKAAGIAQPPSTWTQLMTDSEILKSKGIVKYPYAATYAQSESLIETWAQLAGAFGATSLTSASGSPTFNKGPALEALEYMRQMMAKGLTNPASLSFDFDDINNTMASGQAAFALQWDYGYPAMNDPSSSKEVGNIDYALSPGEGNVPTSASDGDLSLAITAHSKYPAEALEYALYMSSLGVQNKYAAQATPMWKSSFTTPSVVKTNPLLFKTIAEGVGHIIERPQVPYYTALSNALQVAIQEALQGKESPQKALNSVVAQIPALKNGTAA
jgi:multiple sugar transport system substrate-binding protein